MITVLLASNAKYVTFYDIYIHGYFYKNVPLFIIVDCVRTNCGVIQTNSDYANRLNFIG